MRVKGKYRTGKTNSFSQWKIRSNLNGEQVGKVVGRNLDFTEEFQRLMIGVMNFFGEQPVQNNELLIRKYLLECQQFIERTKRLRKLKD